MNSQPIAARILYIFEICRMKIGLISFKRVCLFNILILETLGIRIYYVSYILIRDLLEMYTIFLYCVCMRADKFLLHGHIHKDLHQTNKQTTSKLLMVDLYTGCPILEVNHGDLLLRNLKFIQV